MSKFKKIQVKLPPSVERLVKAASLALCRHQGIEGNRPWLSALGASTSQGITGQVSEQKAHEMAASLPGGKVVHGWGIEEIRRKGIDKFIIAMMPRWVVEFDDGMLLCPNTEAGQSILFLPLAQGAHTKGARFNRAVFSNTPIQGSIGHVNPYELTWSTNWGGDQAYSALKRHSHFMPWSEMDASQYLKDQGMSPDSKLDLAMSTDLDELSVAMGVSPHPANMENAALTATIDALRKLQAQGAFAPSDSKTQGERNEL